MAEEAESNIIVKGKLSDKLKYLKPVNGLAKMLVGDKFDEWKTLNGHSFIIGFLVESLRTNDEEYKKTHGNRPVKDVTSSDVSNGKGFMSEVLRCVVSFVDSTSESDVYTTILKIPSISSMETIDGETPPETEIDDRTTEKVVQIHNTEVEFYNELVSTFDLPHIKVFKALPWIIGESEGVLHMEDMTGKGDVMEFLCSLSISQILEIVRHLVHIHKVYLTSDDEYQELWREKHNKNYCTGTTFAGNIKNRELFLEICGDRDFFEPLLKKYYKFGSNPNYNTYSFYQSWKDLSLQPVLVHGDCHAGNIMWKLDEYGNLTDELVALFDWQMMYVGSPMADVGKLLATSVDGHIRRQVEEFIIEFYHDLLEKEMKETGQSSPYSVEQLTKAYDYIFLSQCYRMFLFPLVCQECLKEKNHDIRETRIDTVIQRFRNVLEDMDRLLTGPVKHLFEEFG